MPIFFSGTFQTDKKIPTLVYRSPVFTTNLLNQRITSFIYPGLSAYRIVASRIMYALH